MPNTLIVGDGIAGRTIARELVAQGDCVHIVSDDTRPPTSPVAAGMIAPAAEVIYVHEWFTALQIQAANFWTDYAASLSKDTNVDLYFEREPSLLVAATSGDLSELLRRARVQEERGLVVESLDLKDLRDIEPALSPKLAGGILVKGDAQVDNRSVLQAIESYLHDHDVSWHRGTVTAVQENEHGVQVHIDSQKTLVADRVVLASGAYPLSGVTPEIFPVRGVTLRGRTPHPPRHTIRGALLGRTCYIVIRSNGEIVIGATEEDGPLGDSFPTVREVRDLLDDATTFVPSLGDMSIGDISVGYRPNTRDGMPFVGPLPSHDHIFIHTGHYRHGILLTPFTAHLLADVMSDRVPSWDVSPLDPARLGTSAAR